MTDPNQFTVIREIPFEELEDRLRAVTLRGQATRPYEDAAISVERFTWDQILPTTKYVLTENLGTQRAIRDSLKPLGYDPLELRGGLIIQGSDGKTQGLIPPLVELFESEGDIPYILDGAHRTHLGRLEGRAGFLAVFIRGIRPDCPPYAFPNRWDEIVELQELPQDLSALKNYRNYDDRYALYRDLGPINGSVPRPPKGV